MRSFISFNFVGTEYSEKGIGLFDLLLQSEVANFVELGVNTLILLKTQKVTLIIRIALLLILFLFLTALVTNEL